MMGICNKGAGILAPLIFSYVILRPQDNTLFNQLEAMDEVSRAIALDELILRVVWPYTVVSGVLFLIGVLVKFSILPELDQQEAPIADGQRINKKESFSSLTSYLGHWQFFLHVGTQVIAIDTIINYAGSMGYPCWKPKLCHLIH
ncbi:hypothetical protein KUH03_00725 [Sphingobacterium sp. E70]|uniref:hypothetical protein n=1 Tax=Sphingobacterium sp. E70 TaxID=2853439 RepID=UPI00211BB955|nr:hypothetical protein [Sphingobacterium sp. E70]ULT25571.1 hypothetical protein KUH03_00725 [Sphingobacterium sp. E70]